MGAIARYGDEGDLLVSEIESPCLHRFITVVTIESLRIFRTFGITGSAVSFLEFFDRFIKIIADRLPNLTTE